ncbi:MAG: ABC transporter permease [Acidimicrobiales bacterium]
MPEHGSDQGSGTGAEGVATLTVLDRDDDARIDRELAGLDALDLTDGDRRSNAARFWSAAWPKLAAVAIGLALWQLVVLSGWRDETILPGPVKVLDRFWEFLRTGEFTNSTILQKTIQRALTGYALAVAVGAVVGAAMSQIKVLRTAFASFITGLQTMPSIVWFPAALVLFKVGEPAILFVVVIGAAPSIANGLLAGTDQVPPLLVRAGKVLGARGITLYREVILPASLPSFVSGLKQGWAFSWRSLMAGELIGATNGAPGIGGFLDNQRTVSDYPGLYATMILILLIGIGVDALFGVVERRMHKRRGLHDHAA